MKISATQVGISTTLAGQTVWLPPKPGQLDPMSILLFGKRPARRLDPRRHPRLKRALRKLQGIKEQVAEIAGLPESELTIDLCEGANASISRDGHIGVGKELLEQFPNDDELWVAILGHEVGHAPWTWPKGDLSRLTLKQRNHLYREEEAKADRFAGRVLAELGVAPDRICDFLISSEAFEGHAAADYYPAEIRARMIKTACSARAGVLTRAEAALGGGRLRKRDLR